MIFGPDCMSSEDEDGFSDDADYYEFKERIRRNRSQQLQQLQAKPKSEAELREEQLKIVFTAVSCGKIATVTQELDKGLDVNTDLQMGWTPLLLACTRVNEPMIRLLLDKGADVNLSKDGTTPLLFACNCVLEEGKIADNSLVSIVKLLIDRGANLKCIDGKRRTPLMMAAYNGHLDVVKLLVPLSDLQALDNQRWNALFWAVEGNKLDIVTYLLDQNISYSDSDIRGHSVHDLARINGCNAILDTLPNDSPIDNITTFLNNEQILINCSREFDDLPDPSRPRFFGDISRILYGSRAESLVQLFDDSQVSLCQFMSMDQSDLTQLGVKLPYQRKRIVGCLYNFHKHSFSPRSVPVVPRTGLCTNLDVSSTVVSCVRQVTAMEASLQFILKHSRGGLNLNEQMIRELTSKIHKDLGRLKVVTEEFHRQTETWDESVRPVDLITRSSRRRNIYWSTAFLSSTALVTLVIFYNVKIKK